MRARRTLPILHPAMLGAVAVLVLNDRLLKGVVPEPMTGTKADHRFLYSGPEPLRGAGASARPARPVGERQRPSPAASGMARTMSWIRWCVPGSGPNVQDVRSSEHS